MHRLLSAFTSPLRLTTLVAGFLLGGILLQLIQTAYAAQPLFEPGTTSSVAYYGWIDDTQKVTIDTVQQVARWKSFVGWKSWGFGPEPLWLRVHVPAAHLPGSPPSILLVLPPYLDHVKFYDPALNIVKQAGDFWPSHEDALASTLFTFEVPALSNARDVFIRLESSSTRFVFLSLMSLPEAMSFTRRVEWITASALIFSTVFWIWGIIKYFTTRDQIIGMFAFKQFMVTIVAFSMLGFARVTIGDFFTVGLLSTMTSIAAAMMVAAVMWFYILLLKEYQARPWMLRLLFVGSIFELATPIFAFTKYDYFGLQILNAVVPFLLGWIVITLMTARTGTAKPPISKSAMLVYVSFYFLINSIPTLTHLGAIPETSILVYGNTSSLVLNGLLMIIVLNVRQKRLKNEHQTINEELRLRHEQARIDQMHLEDQRKLLAMLAHEMKTPLSNLRVWLEAGPKGRPVMERAIYDMDRVVERCVHAGQISERALEPHNETLDASEFTNNIINLSQNHSRINFEAAIRESFIFADAQMLSIVLSNVLENAVKYSPADSTILAGLEAHTNNKGIAGLRWTFENAVANEGLPDPNKVFNKYYRGTHAQRRSGSGLGLFLAKSLIELMQGEIIFIAKDQRVKLWIWLPYKPSEKLS